MEEPRQPGSDLDAQARELRERYRDVTLQPVMERKSRSESTLLWYISAAVIAVALLSYFLVPAVRDRTAERLARLAGTDAPPSTLAPPVAPAQESATATLPSAAGVPDSAPPVKAASEAARNRASTSIEPPQAPPPSVPAAAPVRTEEPAPPRQVPSSPRPSPRTSGGERPVLRRGNEPVETAPPLPEAKAPEPPAAKEPAAGSSRGEEAFKILLDKVPAMAAVAGQTSADLKLKGWSVVKAEEAEVWIDLVATRTSDGREEHFIWKVMVDDLAVTPLNQSARRVVAK